jgi:glycine/D-amino acid oxidase-like deaminating enzyme
MAFPKKARFVVIGAGIHGLSTAWHLAKKLKAKGIGDGSKILVIDKNSIASGASGVACGVVRNNYYQPAMRELMAHSVEVWESDPEAFHYHPVGYMQISPKSMEEDVSTIYEQQKEIKYESTFIQGEKESFTYMKEIFSDWQAKGITSVLHEKKRRSNTKVFECGFRVDSIGMVLS